MAETPFEQKSTGAFVLVVAMNNPAAVIKNIMKRPAAQPKKPYICIGFVTLCVLVSMGAARGDVRVSLGSSIGRYLDPAGLQPASWAPSESERVGSAFINLAFWGGDQTSVNSHRVFPGELALGNVGYKLNAAGASWAASIGAGRLGMSASEPAAWFIEPSVGVSSEWLGVTASISAGYLAGVGEVWFGGYAMMPIGAGLAVGPDVRVSARRGKAAEDYAVRVADRISRNIDTHLSLGEEAVGGSTQGAYVAFGVATSFR